MNESWELETREKHDAPLFESTSNTDKKNSEHADPESLVTTNRCFTAAGVSQPFDFRC